MMKIRPTHATVLLKLRPDIHSEVLGWLKRGEEIDNPIWGKVKVGSPIKYAPTTKRDNFAFAEVLAVGNGSPVGSGMDKPEVKEGNIVGFDLCQLGHELPDGSCSMLWKQLICRFDNSSLIPAPLSSWVLCQEDGIMHQRFVMGRRFEETMISIPGKGTVSTGGGTFKTIKLRCDKVVAVGPGRYVKSIFVESGVKCGDGAAFMPLDGVHITLPDLGRLTFVRWDDVEFVLSPREDTGEGWVGPDPKSRQGASQPVLVM